MSNALAATVGGKTHWHGQLWQSATVSKDGLSQIAQHGTNGTV